MRVDDKHRCQRADGQERGKRESCFLSPSPKKYRAQRGNRVSSHLRRRTTTHTLTVTRGTGFRLIFWVFFFYLRMSPLVSARSSQVCPSVARCARQPLAKKNPESKKDATPLPRLSSLSLPLPISLTHARARTVTHSLSLNNVTLENHAPRSHHRTPHPSLSAVSLISSSHHPLCARYDFPLGSRHCRSSCAHHHSKSPAPQTIKRHGIPKIISTRSYSTHVTL